jgi:hypothetical protein
MRRARCGCCLVINRCPFCGKRHVHGDAGDPGPGFHGHRLGHCREWQTAQVGYVLVECATPVTYTLAPLA